MEFVNEIAHDLLIRRERPRTEDLRGYYFRDITAIIHSNPFRRLKHKTQVFFAPKNDHICTRIEHVMHVATISATICKALGLDVDLAWAISLGHDLGHTPFGHVGEKVLAELAKERGGFNHEIFSLRVVDHLIGYGKGLNLTYAVRDGIINHCGEEFEQSLRPDFHIKELGSITTLGTYPTTWEGTIMRMSDKVAYLGRDLEDAIQLGLIAKSDLPESAVRVLGNSNSEIIDAMVNDIIDTAEHSGSIGFSDKVYEALTILKDFNYQRIYLNPLLSDYHAYFGRIMKNLFEYLDELQEKNGLDFEKYRREKNQLAVRYGDFLSKMKSFYEESDKSWRRCVVDYIAGMTDDFALECINEIMIPKRFESLFELRGEQP
ncbi:MAG TPA: HD domain-containing protein [Spirochaetia bacterium]|nr:HD domain-containing protein [Spirochaetia bacterium]